MNVFAAAESHLAQRIRRTLAGGVRRMSTRSRVITAVVLCGACAAVLPSTGIAQTRDSVDWEMARTTAPEEWSEELKSQIIAAGYDLEAIAERIRLGQQEDARRTEGDGDSDRLAEFQRGVAARAMAIPPEEWNERLKAAIVRAGWDLDEFTEGIRQRQAFAHQAKREDGIDWRAVAAMPPEEWSEELKSQIIAAGHDLEEIAERIRLRQQEEVARRTDEDGDSDRLAEFQRGVAARAMATTPEEWDEEMKRAIRRAGWDPVVLAERVRQARASDSESVDLSELQSGASTVIQERTWGQVKREVANPE